MARQKTPRHQWSESFEHCGHRYVIEGNNLDFSGERAVKGNTRREEDYWKAELALIGNTVTRILKDGEVVWKQGDSSVKLPSEDDPQTGESTGDAILAHVITRHAPTLADKFNDVFEEYYDESLLMEDPLNGSPKPTPLSAAPTKPDEE